MRFAFKNLKMLSLLIVLAFFSAVLVYSQYGQVASVFHFKNDNHVFYKGNKGIALTFNIGWGDENASKVLDVLEKENYRSVTFFLSGAWVERHQPIVERMMANKYEIGILGYNYEDYTELTDKEVSRDINKAIVACNKIGVKNIKLLRTPTGDFDERTTKIADKLGLTLVQWSIDTKDWKNPGTDKIVNSCNQVGAGDVILLHASDSALQTAKALPRILDQITNSKNQPSTISEMLASGASITREVSLGF